MRRPAISCFTRKRVCASLLLTAALFVVFSQLGGGIENQDPAAEPSFEKRALCDWVLDLYSDEKTTRVAAVDAIKAIGVPAVPFLRDVLRDRRSPYRKHVLNHFRRRHPTIDASGRIAQLKLCATIGLLHLGPDGIPAIPELNEVRITREAVGVSHYELVDILGPAYFWTLQDIAKGALARLGHEAINPLLDAAERANEARRFPLLGSLLANARAGVMNRPLSLEQQARIHALLRPIMDGDDDYEHNIAARFIVILPRYHREAAPWLALITQNSSRSTRSSATQALGQLQFGQEQAVPALVRLLGETDRQLQIAAARALGNLGSHAKSATARMTALSEQLRDIYFTDEKPDPSKLSEIRHSEQTWLPVLYDTLSRALDKINPEQASKKQR
ncbi:MAG: hypothetical protein ACI9VS_002160 [Candidatus Binatia bacterium]|jgi:hypothetical protein